MVAAKKEKFDIKAMIAEFEKMTTQEICEKVNSLKDSELEKIVNLIEDETIVEIILSSNNQTRQRIFYFLSDEKLGNAMREISTSDTIAIIECMPEKISSRIAGVEEILELIKQHKFAVLKPILHAKNPIDIAELLNKISESNVVVTFRILPKDLAAETFVEMNTDLQKLLIDSFNDIELKSIIDELFLDDTVDIIEEMPASVVKRIIAQSDDVARGQINEFLKYPKDSAGSIMTIEFITLRPQMTILEALEKIRRQAIDKETIYTCYVTDNNKKLLGIVSAKNLMLNAPDALIKDIMNENVIYANTHTNQEEVAKTISKYGFLALPIVDTEHCIVGIVTVDDAMKIIQYEALDDLSKMSAVTPHDMPYLKTSVFKIWLNRAPWLLILMVSATFTSMVISSNEAILNKIGIVLTACIPMLMGTGGNAGAQASATIIRGIALGEVTFKDWYKVVWKELRASVLLGLSLAVVCFAKLLLIDKLYNFPNGYLIAFAICLTMFIAVIMAKMVGCTMPLLAKKCKLDPAVVANPFISTIVDIVSLLIYCGITVALLSSL